MSNEDGEFACSVCKTACASPARPSCPSDAAEVSDGKEAILKAVETEPDIAVVTDTLPLADGIDGIEATRQIHARSPKTKVLVFAKHDNESLIEELLKAGARGYVRKSDAKRRVEAIEALAANKRFPGPTDFLANGDCQAIQPQY